MVRIRKKTRKRGPLDQSDEIGDAIYYLESAARHAEEVFGKHNDTAEKFRAIARAIHRIVETLDEEGTQGELDRRARDAQVFAAATAHGSTYHPDAVRAAQQRYSAVVYASAREAFMRAWRFEKAMEVLR